MDALPASGTMSVASMRSSVVLPAPLGPSRPVICAVGRRERHVAHGVDFAVLAERLGQAFDADHGCGSSRSGHSGGGALFSK